MLAIACIAAFGQARADDGIEIVRAAIEASDDGYRLNTVYDFELNHGLKDAWDDYYKV